MNLTTATPSEIDSQLAELDRDAHRLEQGVTGAVLSIRSSLGQKSKTYGRGAYKVTEWPTTEAEAIAALRAMGDAYVGMGRTADSVIKRYDEAVAKLKANHAEQAPLDAEWERRQWTRFFIVKGGHIHTSRHCSTCNRGKYRTDFGWMPDMSGMAESDALVALAERAFILCTVCFPNAPVLPTAPDTRYCKGSGERPIPGTSRGGSSIYADCKVCTDRPLITTWGVTRKHKAKTLRESAPAAPAAPAPVAPMTEQPQPQHAGRDALGSPAGETPAAAPTGLALVRMAAGREAASVVRTALVLIGQIVRELDDRQVTELGRRIGKAEPQRYAGRLHPFLAARLATADESQLVDEVHPGFGGISAAYAALAAEIEAQAADPAGYLADHLGAMDDAAAAARVAGAGVTRQQAYLERDQDQDDEGDEARDCVRAATGRNADGQRTQWCATHRQSEVIEEEDDLDTAVAAVVADLDANAAGAVTVADPVALLALVRHYGAAVRRTAARRSASLRPVSVSAAYAEADRTLAEIARLLGLAEAEPAPAGD